MVHALREAWRVARPGGQVIDLRPRGEPSHVGVVQNGRFTEVDEAEEDLGGYQAAREAVLEAVDLGLFVQPRVSRFSIKTEFTSLEDLREWLYALDSTVPRASYDQLVQRVGEVSEGLEAPSEAAAVVPFGLKILTKGSG